MRAIQIEEFGGPEVLIRVTRAGLNFADTHARQDTYLAKQQLPLIPGGEVDELQDLGSTELGDLDGAHRAGPYPGTTIL